jgi:hypothetical protein
MRMPQLPEDRASRTRGLEFVTLNAKRYCGAAGVSGAGAGVSGAAGSDAGVG